jgi:DNA-binding response OmpR family regulator
MKTLLVEDDPLLGQGIQDALSYNGYRVEWVQNGRQALSFAESAEFDVMVLDLGLPDLDGLAVLKQLRTQQFDTPILILTARDSTEEKVAGLDLGADDYMVKPFDLPELMARLRALQRRESQQRAPTLRHADIEINPANHTVLQGNTPVALSRHEFNLLHYLMARPEQVFSRQALTDKLYSWDQDVGSNTVEVYIHHLRKKLGKDIVQTVRGIGYKLGGAPD